MVTPKDELTQPLNFQLYAYLTDVLGLVPSPRTQQGIQEMLRILTPVRDAEGTRLITGTTFEVVSTAVAANLTAPAAGHLRIYEAVAVTIATAASDTYLCLFNGSGVARIAYQPNLPVGDVIVAPRRLVVGPGDNLRGVQAGANVTTIEALYWDLLVGDYVLIP